MMRDDERRRYFEFNTSLGEPSLASEEAQPNLYRLIPRVQRMVRLLCLHWDELVAGRADFTLSLPTESPPVPDGKAVFMQTLASTSVGQVMMLEPRFGRSEAISEAYTRGFIDIENDSGRLDARKVLEVVVKKIPIFVDPREIYIPARIHFFIRKNGHIVKNPAYLLIKAIADEASQQTVGLTLEQLKLVVAEHSERDFSSIFCKLCEEVPSPPTGDQKNSV